MLIVSKFADVTEDYRIAQTGSGVPEWALTKIGQVMPIVHVHSVR
jgi:hypothetical protein